MISFQRLLWCFITATALLGTSGCKWLRERLNGPDLTVEIADTSDGRPRFVLSGGPRNRGASADLLIIQDLRKSETVCFLLADTRGPADLTYLKEWKYGVKPAGYRMEGCGAPLPPGKYRLRLKLPSRSPYWDFEVNGIPESLSPR